MRLRWLILLASACFLISFGCSGDPEPKDLNDAGPVDEDTGSQDDTGDADADADEEEPEHCFDGELSGDETDVDCGGSCEARCEIGQGCQIRTDCITLECDQDDFVCIRACPDNCSGNGECQEDGVCDCDDGYLGDDCATHEDDEECLNDCSGNGTCDDGTCDCDDGFIGPDCSVQDTGGTDCPNDCSGNGTCFDGVCQCNPGWTGDDCSIEDDGQSCPNDCSGNGTCSDGICYCYSGWTGPDCSQQECTPSCMNGYCQNGACNCDPGWTGSDCSIPE